MDAFNGKSRLLYKDERTPREYKVFDRCHLFDKRLFHGTVVDPVLVLVELTEDCRMSRTISSAVTQGCYRHRRLYYIDVIGHGPYPRSKELLRHPL